MFFFQAGTVSGSKSSAAGKTYEAMADLAGRRYEADRLAKGIVNYPEIMVTRFPNARIIGKGASDRSFTVQPLGGQAVHFDVKGVDGIHSIKYPFRDNKDGWSKRAQYLWMLDMAEFTPMVFYLVFWHRIDEWRVHFVSDLLAHPDNSGIQFVRAEALLVNNDKGYPDWLPCILSAALLLK